MDPVPSEEALQADFEQDSKDLSHDKDTSPAKVTSSCILYDDFTFFDLTPLQGPYAYQALVNGANKKFEVRFCNPAYQVIGSGEGKSSLVFLLDDENLRATRLTSGSATMNYTRTLRKLNEEDENNDVVGIFYDAEPITNGEECVASSGDAPARPYIVDYTVNCDASGARSDFLQKKDFSVAQDANDKCLFHVTATHAAGCAKYELSGLIQYITSHPYLVAAIFISFGVVSTFFGGLLFDWVVASIAGIMVFLIVSMLFSSFGGFKALETHAELNAGRILFAIFSLLVSLAAAFFAGWLIKKTTDIAAGVLGAIGGFFGAFLLFNLVFAKFVTQSTWLLWVCLIVGVAGGFFLTYYFKKNIIIQLTAVVGAYTLIRGIGMIAGGYPNEFEMFSQMKAGTFELPNTYYAYLAGFVALGVSGTFWQYYKGYDKQVRSNTDLDENYKHQE